MNPSRKELASNNEQPAITPSEGPVPSAAADDEVQGEISIHHNIPLEAWQVEAMYENEKARRALSQADSGQPAQGSEPSPRFIPITSPDAHVIYVNLPEGSSGKLPPDRPEDGVYFR